MICYIEKQIFRSIGNEKIMQHFEEMKKRRMLLPKQNVVVCRSFFSYIQNHFEVVICRFSPIIFLLCHVQIAPHEE